MKCSMSRQSSMTASSSKSIAEGTVRRTFNRLSEEDAKELERKVAEMQYVEADVATMLSKAWQKEQQQQAPLQPTHQAGARALNSPCLCGSKGLPKGRGCC